MLPGFVRRSVAVLVRGAVLGFYLSQVRCVFFFVLSVFFSLVVGCGGEGEGVRGASATLSWDPGHGNAGIIYTVHYGKSSTGELGFTVSAYNGERSLCSNEVSKLTSEEEFHIGDRPVQVLTPNQELYIGDPPVKL